MTQPLPDWFPLVRSILEALYFLSGVALVVIAVFGLRQLTIGLEQIKLTKEIADANSKRESVRLAAAQCRYFAEEAVPAWEALIAESKKLNVQWIPPQQANQPQQPTFVLNEGEFVKADFDIAKVAQDWAKIGATTVKFLNRAESFAIPFAAGVADDAIGFQETAAAFCTSISHCMPAIYFLRQTQAVGYRSALRLFWVWNNRIAAQVVAPLIKGMQEMVQAADKNKIRPL